MGLSPLSAIKKKKLIIIIKIKRPAAHADSRTKAKRRRRTPTRTAPRFIVMVYFFANTKTDCHRDTIHTGTTHPFCWHLVVTMWW